jgi:hypothetical protein
MKRQTLMLLGILGAMLLTTGCRSLFSSSESTTVSRWKSYDEVELAFLRITPYQTTVADLRTLGFDPKDSPNVKILTYVDIIQTFMPNPAIHKQDLPDAVRECIAAKENSLAYLVEPQDIRDKRHGNLFLDVFGFKRQTHESGWRFKGLILIKGDLVVYKLSSGEPRVSREDKKVKPLGPLQELDTVVTHAVANGNY